MAVEALYTSIPHSLGLQSVAHFLNTRGRQFGVHGQFVVDLLKFTLTHNYFLFSGVFHQLQGTEMSSPCAPSYANLYLVFSDNPLQGVDHVGLWACYIDDIFVIWQGSEDEFLSFIEQLNNNSLGLHFTWEINKSSLAFLEKSWWVTLHLGNQFPTQLELRTSYVPKEEYTQGPVPAP